MIQLNALELEAFDALCAVREAFAPGRKLARWRFAWVMGQVRTAIVHLENKRFGCRSGLHASACTCLPDKPGVNADNPYRKRKKEAA